MCDLTESLSIKSEGCKCEAWSEKLRRITFLAVNDEVSFPVACCNGVDYTIAIWVFGQNCGDEGVGARVLRNKRSVSAKKNSSLTSARN